MSVLVGKMAPNFTATAVMPDNTINQSFNLHDYLGSHIGVLFFYPLNFTFVCPSEIIRFNEKIEEFEKRGVKLIGVSVDSQFSHLAYKNTSVNKGGIGQIQFPLVADLSRSIAQAYDVLINDSVALRGTFLIDQLKVVRHQVVNDLPLGRNIEEAIRMVDALVFHQEHGEVCPANWNPGKSGMKPTQEGVSEYLTKNFANSTNN